MALPRAIAHKLLVTSSLLTVFFFSGVIFGWDAFSAILESEGYYDWQCQNPDPGHPCNAQIQSLNTAFAFSSTVVTLSAFANGWLVDTLGPSRVTVLAGTMCLLGLLGIASTGSGGITKKWAEEGIADVLPWATVLTAWGGSLTMFIGYQAPFVVPSHFTLLITLNSCLFDAGTIMFPVLKAVYGLGVPFAALFWAYVGLAAVCFTLLAVAWCLNEQEFQEIRDTQAGDPGCDGAASECERPLSQRRMGLQLMTFQFAAIFAYSVVMVPRSNLYMGTFGMVNRHIAGRAGEAPSLEGVDTAVGFIVPFGVLAAPLIEVSMHRLGTVCTIQLTTAIGVLYNLLQLAESLHVQILAACVFAAWRAFLFSAISAFNGETFGAKTMGRIMGHCFLFAGIANLAIGPVANAAVGSDDFLPLLLGDLLVCLPLPFLFLPLQKGCGRRGEAHGPLAAASAPFVRLPEADPGSPGSCLNGVAAI